MKKRIYLTTLILMCFTLILTLTPANASFLKSKAEIAQDRIEKALELKEIGLIEQSNTLFKEAETTLTQALTANTNDLDALYTLGTLNYYKGQISTAEKRFNIVYSRNPEYGKKIRDFYLNLSKKAKQSGRLDSSITYAVRAYDYYPAEKNRIAEEFFKTGSNLLFKRELNSALLYYRASVKLNPDYREPNTLALITACEQQTDPKQRLRLLHASLEFSNDIQSSRIIKVAELIGHQLKNQKIKQATITNDLKQLPKTVKVIIVKIAYPPDYKIYPKGTYTFSLKAGEVTKKWITFPNGVLIHLDSKDRKYKLIYPDGSEKSAWLLKKLPNKYKFKLLAVTDQSITLKVK